jgi:hypothetical protein
MSRIEQGPARATLPEKGGTGRWRPDWVFYVEPIAARGRQAVAAEGFDLRLDQLWSDAEGQDQTA